jgi:hypothetical protein
MYTFVIVSEFSFIFVACAQFKLLVLKIIFASTSAIQVLDLLELLLLVLIAHTCFVIVLDEWHKVLHMLRIVTL